MLYCPNVFKEHRHCMLHWPRTFITFSRAYRSTMAHLMPIAGMPTELSEHFVFYHVIPKPTQRVWCRAEMVNICSIRPKFVCFSHSAVENRDTCNDRRPCRHQARHGAVKCSCLHCRKQAPCGCCLHCCREGAEGCCLHATKDVGEQCRLCMVKHIAKRNRSDCCISKNQLLLRSFTITITG